MKIFCDIHFHAMTLNHPNFLAFLNNLISNFGDSLLADIFSPRYIFDRKDKNKLSYIKNMISVMENDIASVFMLMEDDLMGKYNGKTPYIRDNHFYFREKEYEKVFLCPLVMDFDNPFLQPDDIYYKKPPAKPLKKVADSVLDGISEFYRARPETMLRIFPFLGINPKNYSNEEIDYLLKKYLPAYSTAKNFRENIVDMTAKFRIKFKPLENFAFSGIKLYPPLGFDPWPDDGEELEKVKQIYSFAVKNKIPLTVHCDDQGFRTISLRDAWKFTSPKRWENVFEKYPSLKVNFAHFGMQYYRKFGIKQQWVWNSKIVEYIMRYDNVYADISFNATVNSYLHQMVEKLKLQPDFVYEKICKRIMFGTDFPVNLSKIESYYDYYSRFENIEMSDEVIEMVGSSNCSEFIFGRRT